MTNDDLSRLFEAERAVRPPPQALEQGLSRLLTDVAQQVAPLSVATGSLKLGVSAVSKWLIGGFIVGLAGAGTASQIWTPEAVTAVSVPVVSVAQTTRVEAPVQTAAVTHEAPPEAQPEPEPTPAATAHSDRPMPSTTPATSANASTFDAELQLITAAKSELDRGRPQLAAAWLSEHAERFPAGIFALDREALRILIRCSQRKDPAAARAFATQHPSSPMVERLQRACTPSAPSGAPSTVDFPK